MALVLGWAQGLPRNLPKGHLAPKMIIDGKIITRSSIGRTPRPSINLRKLSLMLKMMTLVKIMMMRTIAVLMFLTGIRSLLGRLIMTQIFILKSASLRV
jgi:hypothetical protein